MVHSDAGLRLSDRYTSVAALDLDEAKPAITRLQGSFSARPAAVRQPERPVHVRAAMCGQVALSTFCFGRAVDIVPHGLAGAVLVTTAIGGRAGLAARGATHGIGAGASFITHEEDAPTFLYQPDTEVLKLRFERSRLEACGARLHGHAGALRFEPLMAQAGSRWSALLRYVVATLNAPVAASSMELAGMEDMLMLTLLSVQPSNYLASQREPAHAVSPRQFRRAVDYIDAHLDGDIRLPDIAAAAACSVRSLTRAFHQASDTTPMQYVHAQRLQRVHGELARADEAATIADIAYQWGFRHLGEFNRKYRETFGETPTATRQRGRR
jgi:AraC-like DNA-binding protein